jgi:hypothetical protein
MSPDPAPVPTAAPRLNYLEAIVKAISSGISHEIAPAAPATMLTSPAADTVPDMAITVRATPPATISTHPGDAPDPYPAGVPPEQEATGSKPTEEGASKDPAAALKAGMEAGDCPGGDPGRGGDPPNTHRLQYLHSDGSLTLCRNCTYFFFFVV